MHLAISNIKNIIQIFNPHLQVEINKLKTKKIHKRLIHSQIFQILKNL